MMLKSFSTKDLLQMRKAYVQKSEEDHRNAIENLRNTLVRNDRFMRTHALPQDHDSQQHQVEKYLVDLQRKVSQNERVIEDFRSRCEQHLDDVNLLGTKNRTRARSIVHACMRKM
uniref:Uncharacterized protein n=1 Tax=Lotharella oceanica TaxID=641309 RepID=A0A7S2TI52_9EUKA|mmetsp:Transcript_15232/g.28986  ORF Transcript_15232/g.28986 Transcript_15232/m.28986 type:complete len:115 (+) Transcript_15232:109-453(+)|eukprot:CAMPEP_0170185144 /NCGR_PEP_ID=MMETSP0040_2-20121228/35754_1 /TAXON_ID=641309 /ORGANISM="Lotharella oceanica, Strain CCMP622" /LENGTH=114 /DNA_ID=CAMNT_0010431451 /DNA_START=133 /DNA_END=477 /DNA_ORIENTATION=+